MIDEDDTLSLSFVDCISCGLAAALFLLIIFAILPRSMAGQTSGSASSSSQSRILYDDSTGSNFADVEIHVANVAFAPSEGTWLAEEAGSLVFALRGQSIAYFRELPSGNLRSVEFTVPARGRAPRGHIYLHTGGRSERTEFDCQSQPASGDTWTLLRNFDPRTRKALGDCILEGAGQ